LAWLGLAWLGLAWLGLAWLGLAWLGLAWLGLAWPILVASYDMHGLRWGLFPATTRECKDGYNCKLLFEYVFICSSNQTDQTEEIASKIPAFRPDGNYYSM
jgi:hypothetical protein